MVDPWYNGHGRDNETRSGRSYSYNMLVTTMTFLIGGCNSEAAFWNSI